MSDLRIRLAARRLWRRDARHRLPRPQRHRTFLRRCHAGAGLGRGVEFHLRRRFRTLARKRRKP